MFEDRAEYARSQEIKTPDDVKKMRIMQTAEMGLREKARRRAMEVGLPPLFL